MQLTPIKHSYLYIFYSLMIIFGHANYAMAAPQCHELFSSENSLWRSSGGSLFMDIRDNCPHYWAWVKSISKKDISADLLSEGIIVGDPHILNFADALINGERKMRLVDLDDSGHGPFLFDFTKFVTSVKSQRLGLTTKDLFEMYHAGLMEEKEHKPDFLKDALNKTHKEEKKHEKERLKKLVNGDSFNFEVESYLMKISSAPEEIQKLYDQDKSNFKKALKDFKILDHTVRIKPTGGSAYHPRFWFLVEDKDEKKLIIEFKLDTQSGIAQLEPQADFIDRIEEVMDVYWKGERDPLYRAVESGNRSYFMRPKYKPFVEFLEIKSAENKADAREFLLHIAYHMGRMVARQKSASGYVDAVDLAPAKTATLINSLADQYLAIAKELHR